MAITEKLGLGLAGALIALGLTVTAGTPEAKAGGAVYWNNGGNGAYVRRGGYYGPSYYYGPTYYRRGGAAYGPNGACAAGPYRAGCVRY